MIERLHTGPRMSQTVIHGNTVYLAGQVADDPRQDVAGRTRQSSVWDTWVAQGRTPARATVEAKLAAPQYTVEIQVIAARDVA